MWNKKLLINPSSINFLYTILMKSIKVDQMSTKLIKLQIFFKVTTAMEDSKKINVK